MKALMQVEKEVEVNFLKLSVAVRYDDEDIPYDFPLREGDMWNATINIDSGAVENWPKGESGRLFMKVCDQGSYYLQDETRETILFIEDDYVPNSLIPGEYGDYIDLNIDENGIVTNWYKKPSLEDFMQED